MGHTFSNHLYHIVFSTKERRRYIQGEAKARLLDYICGVATKKGGVVIRVDGTEDHLHLLARIKPNISVAKFVGDIKANTSRWLSQTFPDFRSFRWQGGYSSFTVSKSNWEGVADYIDRQEEHHRKMTFEEELKKLLRRHELEFDPEDYLD